MTEEIPFREPRRGLVIAVLALAVIGVLVSFLTVQRLEATRIRLEFERAAADRVRAVQGDLDGFTNDLHAISAFFRASEKVTREEFSEFARPLHARHGGLRAFDWIPRVPDERRADYERQVRSELPEFQIKELDTHGRLKSASSRAEYFPIDYIEPVVAGDEPVRGFDISSHPVTDVPLSAARDTGAISIAGPLPLFVDQIDPSGYMVFLPYYRDNTIPQSVEARRQAFAGVIAGVLQLTQVLHEAVSRLEQDGIDVELADGGNSIAMYRRTHPENTTASSSMGRERTLGYTVVEPIPFGDRTLEIRCSATTDFVGRHASVLPWIVLAGGGFLVITLAFYLTRLLREIRKRRSADTALRESERRYRILVEHAPEAIVVLDLEKNRFVDLNENAVKLFKYSRERLLGMRPEDLSPQLQPDGRSSAMLVRESLAEALRGAVPIFPWVHRDSEGREIPCEVRLVRLPPKDRMLVRGSVIDVSDRRQAELRQLTMARELDHRVKNNLAEVLALVDQSGRSAGSYEEFRDAFAGRVRAMARTHEALAARRWQGVPLREIADLTLGPYESRDDRVVKRGDTVVLAPHASSALGMVLHELAANAAKHGALAMETGRIELSWHRGDDGSLEAVWQESGVPSAKEPASVGFGLRLVRGVVTHELGGTLILAFGQPGFRAEIRIPREHLEDSEKLTRAENRDAGPNLASYEV